MAAAHLTRTGQHYRSCAPIQERRAEGGLKVLQAPRYRGLRDTLITAHGTEPTSAVHEHGSSNSIEHITMHAIICKMICFAARVIIRH